MERLFFIHYHAEPREEHSEKNIEHPKISTIIVREKQYNHESWGITYENTIL